LQYFVKFRPQLKMCDQANTCFNVRFAMKVVGWGRLAPSSNHNFDSYCQDECPYNNSETLNHHPIRVPRMEVVFTCLIIRFSFQMPLCHSCSSYHHHHFQPKMHKCCQSFLVCLITYHHNQLLNVYKLLVHLWLPFMHILCMFWKLRWPFLSSCLIRDSFFHSVVMFVCLL
jgi:hypothetical protein